ncbi:hypothetical protein NsoK4_03590 [Nitrosopumilus sp. K4]|uniref:hypothetical protein n=1 Tax=Nitrosopumilus sp. K4 TaxID=2795383 RepID=UPI001BA69836|nr:hypothetical protein [Nitrosopumilus sp. K4]QUC65338.1 hypothetical protein NsoK4_03590 [Nitrosopumilus sp. K4]
MDDRREDTSEESFEKHLVYYKSLSKIIKDNQREIESEAEETIKNHLKERIKAMNLDKERIENMFPDKIKELRDE